jgi:hypothetical protein
VFAALWLVPATGHAQSDLARAALPIAKALAADGLMRSPVIVAAMTDCKRDLKDPTCQGATYPSARRDEAQAMAMALASALGVPASTDAVADAQRLLGGRSDRGPDVACHDDANVVRTVLAAAPIYDDDARAVRIGIVVKQLPSGDGCRVSGRLLEFTLRRSTSTGAMELVDQRLLLTGTGAARARGG